MDILKGWGRDALHYNLHKKFLIYMIAGVILCTTIIAKAAPDVKDKTDNTVSYCTWTPKRGASAIYWVVEFLPRKTACLLWMPFGYSSEVAK